MKTAHWLGLGTDSVRVVETNERGVMVTEALNKAIEEEIQANNIPLMVNATAGTTVLGAIDDLQSVAATCKKFGVWMHVDVSFATSYNKRRTTVVGLLYFVRCHLICDCGTCVCVCVAVGVWAAEH